MTVAALYNAVRAHCIEISGEFRAARGRFIPPHGIDPANSNSAFPPLMARAAVCEAVLKAIEASRPQAFPDEAHLRSFLARTIAETPRWGVPAHGLAQAEREESDPFDLAARGALQSWIEKLDAATMGQFPTVPYRRQLGLTRRARIHADAQRRWQFDAYNYPHPYGSGAIPSGGVVFTTRGLRLGLGASRLADVLMRHGIQRIWQIDVSGLNWGDYELDPRFLDFRAMEIYWTSHDLDWLIYSSHELVTAVLGDWLLNAIKAAWPEWEEHVSQTYQAYG